MSERLDESTEKRGDTYKHYNILGGRTGRGTALEYNTTRQAAVTTGDPGVVHTAGTIRDPGGVPTTNWENEHTGHARPD